MDVANRDGFDWAEMQGQFLPQRRPALAEYEFFDAYQPVGCLGGDYYDYVTLADGRSAVVIADVAGVSPQVGLQMAFLSGAVRSVLSTADSPRAALRTLNTIICTLRSSGYFVTSLLIALDPRSHACTIVNAGHLPVLWRHSDGSVEEPGQDQSGLPLGLLDDSDYAETTIELAPDDLLVLYTDGVPDTLDAVGRVFGLRGLRSCLANAGRDAITVGNAILAEVSRFQGDAPVTDDMCLVCVRRLP